MWEVTQLLRKQAVLSDTNMQEFILNVLSTESSSPAAFVFTSFIKEIELSD